MATLLLRLAAPLQSWGSQSKFNIRLTDREPTKSGVVGMLAAALGIQRNDDPKKLEPLNALRFGVRVEKEGKLLRDFHTVHGTQNKCSYITERFYLSDAVFMVALESENREFLEQLIYALNHPVYALFLGRRSCPPTLPIVLGIRDDEFLNVLKTEPPVTSYKPTRIIYDSAGEGAVVWDKAISFSQLHRQYGPRRKKEELLMECEHDPIKELEDDSMTELEHDPMTEL